MKRTILAVLLAASFGVTAANATGDTNADAKPATATAAVCREAGQTTPANLPACPPKTEDSTSAPAAAPAAATSGQTAPSDK